MNARPLNPARFRPRPPSCRGSRDLKRSQGGSHAFSLLEVLGALAILAILAVAIVPMLQRQFERRARGGEEAALKNLVDGLERYVLRSHVIPDETTFDQAVATELGLHVDEVNLNQRGRPRIYLIDPALRIGKDTGQGLPYTQTLTGSIEPISPRVLILSSLATPLPPSIVHGLAASKNAFNAIWDAPAGAVPAGWNWDGQGQDLKIARLNLAPLFKPLVLDNDSPQQGKFAVDGSATSTLPTDPFAAYYLLGTILDLYGSDDVHQSTEVIQNKCAYIYELGVWHTRIYLGRSGHHICGLDAQAAADLILGTPVNPNAKGNPPAVPLEVIYSMAGYMENYIAWAAAGFPYSPSDLEDVSDAQSLMDTLTVNYIFKP